jgi:hypothetical protein
MPMPASVMRVLQWGGCPRSTADRSRDIVRVIGPMDTFARAAEAALRSRGIDVSRVDEPLAGDVTAVAARLVSTRSSRLDAQAVMPSAPPLISCLMLTRGRLVPTRFAIDCYRRQTWPNRELVIVCDDPDSDLPAYVATLGEPTIR